MITKVGNVRIYVSDLDQAVDFYTKILGLKLALFDDNFGWAQFELDGAMLALERVEPDAHEFDELVGRFAGISLLVDNIDDSYQQLQAAGVEFDSPPEKTGWGGTVARLRDPDNNVLTLAQTKSSA